MLLFVHVQDIGTKVLWATPNLDEVIALFRIMAKSKADPAEIAQFLTAARGLQGII